MEQHLADLQKAQRKKRAMGDNRALQKQALMMPQADQNLPDEVNGTLAGTSISGGAMGLERVVGAGTHMKKGRGKAGAGKLEIVHHSGAGQTGAGVVSDLRIPIISDIARLFGLGKKGKKQGRKAREDEKLGMEVKGLKNKMDGGSYIDPMFGVINQPQGSSEALAQVAGEGPLGSGYSGAGMAKAQGAKMAEYLKEMHGEGYAKEFAGGFWGALASIAAPLIGKLISGKGKKGDKKRRRQETEYSDEELEMIMEDPEEYIARVDAGRPVRSAHLPIVAPLMPNRQQAQHRLGAPLPAAAGALAVQAAQAVERRAEVAPAAAMAEAAEAARRPGNLFAMDYIGRERSEGITGSPAMARPSPASITPPGSPKGKGRAKKAKGGAKPGDRRVARAAIVKQVMAEKGLSMPMASKYVKDHNMF